ncbi:MAG: permease [Melioribacter sp.]|uniref:permease n=1 Tax=Rosettibacter primus TaxID=3111523 RepID=UPI00247D4C7E|nr:permease [Melioribacter sp.]
MINELFKIFNFIFEHLIRVWPYLLITIPVAVTIRMSGASKYINKAFNTRPLIAIFLATIVGAFSPFCSCSVIPIIASLLIGGVPLAPVMSFWLASPSMDPEMFFLSVTTLGWNLAVWRLASTFMMSLSAGFITHYLVKKNWITNEDTLKAHSNSSRSNLAIIKEIVVEIYSYGKSLIIKILSPKLEIVNVAGADINSTCCSSSTKSFQSDMNKNDSKIKMNNLLASSEINISGNNCVCSNNSTEEKIVKDDNNSESVCYSKPGKNEKVESSKSESTCCGGSQKGDDKKDNNLACCDSSNKKSFNKHKFLSKLSKEAYSAAIMVLKFMALAYFLEALIVFYVPSELVKLLLGKNQFLSIILAALMGVPIYTSTMPALALVGGLLIQGMAPAAALAFLISGPTTTIPAMAAVWNLANRKVFLLYVGFTLTGAITSGLFYYTFYLIF